jgi:hypothetical protein
LQQRDLQLREVVQELLHLVLPILVLALQLPVPELVAQQLVQLALTFVLELQAQRVQQLEQVLVFELELQGPKLELVLQLVPELQELPREPVLQELLELLKKIVQILELVEFHPLALH